MRTHIHRELHRISAMRDIKSSFETAKKQKQTRISVRVPDVKRRDLIAALAIMPEEAFSWFVLACPTSAMLHGGHAQIWPDGAGGFSSESRASIDAVRKAADAYTAQ